MHPAKVQLDSRDNRDHSIGHTWGGSHVTLDQVFNTGSGICELPGVAETRKFPPAPTNITQWARMMEAGVWKLLEADRFPCATLDQMDTGHVPLPSSMPG